MPAVAPRALVGAAPDKLFLPLGEQAVATASTAIAMRKGDPDMLSYLHTVLEFRRGSGWLAERARYGTEQATKPR